MHRILLSLAVALLCTTVASFRPGRVHPRDIEAITLRAGSYTEGRRSHRIPQLQAIHVPAHITWRPDSVQCVNTGWDGHDVQWKCETHDMPSNIKFGRMEVNCEGYDSPDDEYILAGSCGLEYELLSVHIEFHAPVTYDNSDGVVALFIAVAVIMACVFLISALCQVASYYEPLHRYHRPTVFVDSSPPPPVYVHTPPPPVYVHPYRSSSSFPYWPSSSSSSRSTSTRTASGFATTRRR